MAGKILYATAGCSNYQHDGKGLSFFRFAVEKLSVVGLDVRVIV